MRQVAGLNTAIGAPRAGAHRHPTKKEMKEACQLVQARRRPSFAPRKAQDTKTGGTDLGPEIGSSPVGIEKCHLTRVRAAAQTNGAARQAMFPARGTQWTR